MAIPAVPITHPLIDKNTGRVAREWAVWFDRLRSQAGGGGGGGSADPDTVIVPESDGAMISGQAGAWAALPPGDDGDLLTMVSGAPAWQSSDLPDLTTIAASVYATDPQTLTSGTPADLEFAQAHFDQGGCWNSFSPTVLMVPLGQGGVYLVRGQVTLEGAFPGVAALRIKQGGVTVAETTWQGTDLAADEAHTVAAFVSCAEKAELSIECEITLATGTTHDTVPGTAATLFQLARIQASSGSEGGASGGSTTIDASQIVSGTIALARLSGITAAQLAANAAIALSQLADISSGVVLGRESAGSGVIEQIVGEAIYTGSGCPQGVKAAAVGRRYRDTANGLLWVKLGGGTTAYGWYPEDTHAGLKHGSGLLSTGGIIIDDTGTVENSFGSIGALTKVAGAGRTRATDATYGLVVEAATTAAINALSSVATTSGQKRWYDTDFDACFVIKTGADITNVRYRIGLPTGTASEDVLSSAGISFRFSTAAGDAGFVGQTRESNAGGAANATTAALNTVAADTWYKLRIRFDRSASTVYFSVDDGTETAVTTGIPAAGTFSPFLYIQITTLAALAKRMRHRGSSAVDGANFN